MHKHNINVLCQVDEPCDLGSTFCCRISHKSLRDVGSVTSVNFCAVRCGISHGSRRSAFVEIQCFHKSLVPHTFVANCIFSAIVTQ